MWIKKGYRGFEIGIAKLAIAFGALTLILLSVMTLLTVTDIVLRYVFNSPISGSLELSEYLIEAAGFSAIGWCALNNKHIQVGVIVDRFSPRVQATITSVCYIAAMPVIALCVKQAILQSAFEKSFKTASDVLHIPAYPFYIVQGVGYAILFLVMITLIVKTVSEAAKK